MVNKINIAELLKDCPKGMELYSPIFGELKFNEVNAINNRILVVQQNDCIAEFESDGRLINCKNGECLLFPSKEKTTWEGFVPPCKFKTGDVLFVDCSDDEDRSYQYIFILNDPEFYGKWQSYCHLDGVGCFHSKETYLTDEEYHPRFATEEEKQKLFDAIKDNGYKWNAETKTLEKLPKFKVGDKIQSVISSSYYTVVDIKNDLYFIKSDTEKYPYQVPFSNEINYKLAPNKFGITNLKPFDKVLVRDNNTQKWTADLFSFFDKSLVYPYSCVGHYTNQCIPYEGNEHLLGTDNDCADYHKNW